MSRRISVVFALVMVIALTACTSSRLVRDARDIRAARGGLGGIQYCLNYFRHMDVWDSYPATATITSHDELIDVLGTIGMMRPPEMTDWTFVSYERPQPNWFIFRVRAHDKGGTFIEVTPVEITVIEP